jgi:hypothetical protein
MAEGLVDDRSAVDGNGLRRDKPSWRYWLERAVKRAIRTIFPV